jgi:hypothetical protein
MHDQLVQQQAQQREKLAQQHEDYLDQALKERQQASQGELAEKRYEYDHPKPTTRERNGADIPLGSDPSGTGLYYFNGINLVPKPKATIDAEAAQNQKRTDAAAVAKDPGVKALDMQIQALQTEANAAGGMDKSRHWWSDSYGKQIENLAKQRADAVAALAGSADGDPAASADGTAAGSMGTAGGSQTTGSGPAATPAATPQDTMPTVTTQAQFNALPSGTFYKRADGGMSRKP